MTDAAPPPQVDPAPQVQPAEPKRGVGALLQDLDHLLRGQFTTPEQLRSGRPEIPIGSLVIACVVLGAFYGAAMGLYAVTTRGAGEGLQQVVSSAVKVPLLFLLTLVVTFPSLYVVSALSRSRLQAGDTLRLLLAAIVVHLALLASLGPVAAFFTLSTDSYPFMKLLHVVFFAAGGLVGLGFLQRALAVILEPDAQPETQPNAQPETQPNPGPPPVPARKEGENVPPTPLLARRPVVVDAQAPIRRVFRVWILIYGVVGAQMGWILRPFIGAPGLDFTWFRPRESNFLRALLDTFAALAG